MTCNAPEPMFPGGFMVRLAHEWHDGGHREAWYDAQGNPFTPEGPLQRNLLKCALEDQRKQVSEQVLEAVAGRPLSAWCELQGKREPWETWVDIRHPGIIPEGLFK